jgi:hypothetical protein
LISPGFSFFFCSNNFGSPSSSCVKPKERGVGVCDTEGMPARDHLNLKLSWVIIKRREDGVYLIPVGAPTTKKGIIRRIILAVDWLMDCVNGVSALEQCACN